MSDEKLYTREELEEACSEADEKGYDKGYEEATNGAREVHEQWQSDTQDVLDQAISIIEDAFIEAHRLKLPD